MNLKDLIPATLGGNPNNIFNHVVAGSKWDRYMGTHQPLWDHIAETQPKNIVEIGLGCGLNGMVMRGLSGANIFIFDNLSQKRNSESYQLLKELDGFEFFIGDSRKTLSKTIAKLPQPDLINIDGDHSYEVCKNDWENCKCLMDENTVVFFHDYNMNGVKKVIDEIDSERYDVEIIEPEYGPTWAKVEAD